MISVKSGFCTYSQGTALLQDCASSYLFYVPIRLLTQLQFLFYIHALFNLSNYYNTYSPPPSRLHICHVRAR